MKAKHDDLHKAALERFAEAEDADQENRKNALEDLQFTAGEQWDADIRAAREEDGRPIITVNRLPQFLRQVTGDIRRTNPSLRVIKGDGDAGEDIAEIYDGLARHIQYACDATSIYEGAAESAAACGIGWFRVLTDYEADDSFHQSIYLERVHNPFSVYVDPEARDPARADARYMFVTERMPKEEFERQYPKARSVDFEDGAPAEQKRWSETDDVRIAEYWWKEPSAKTLARFADGRVELMDAAEVGVGGVIATRRVETHEIRTCKMTGTEVVEPPRTWPGKFFPIVAVVGEEVVVGERTVRCGVIRYAKDPQRLYNYARSTQAEVVALQPKAPFIATVEQIAGLESEWAQANRVNKSVLRYNADQYAPGAPQRAAPPLASQGLAQEIMLAAEDMKATTGIYDAALGERSNEQSGVAIRQRQLESDISTSIYVDNLAKSILQAGRIIVDLIPKIYDARRVIQITGADEEEQSVRVNDYRMGETGPEPFNDLTLGKFDVRITTGPNYTTQRQEAAEGMMAFIQAMPQVGAVTADLIAKSMDWPDAEQFAERLRKAMPPGVADDDEPTPEQAMQAQQMRAMQQQMQAMQQALAQIELRTKAAEAVEAEADAVKAQAEAAQARAEANGAARQDAFEGMAFEVGARQAALMRGPI